MLQEDRAFVSGPFKTSFRAPTQNTFSLRVSPSGGRSSAFTFYLIRSFSSGITFGRKIFRPYVVPDPLFLPLFFSSFLQLDHLRFVTCDL